MVVTRAGLHFPKPEWQRWRNAVVMIIKSQLPPRFKAIAHPVSLRLEYVAEDHRRRDMPAIVDSIFHCLEKAGVVEDDTLCWVTESSRVYDKSAPMAVVTFLDK